MSHVAPTLDLAALIACPSCKGDLLFAPDEARCQACGRGYPRITPATLGYDFLCDDLLGPERARWAELQQRGESVYRLNPSSNCSRWLAGGRYADRFGDFCRLDGLVLDIGCGPHGPYLPSGSAIGTRIVGVEPLPLIAQTDLVLRAIGEHLPLRDATFDHVIMVSSLDHMTDPLAALREAARALRPQGRVHIWTHTHLPLHRDAGRLLRRFGLRLADPRKWRTIVPAVVHRVRAVLWPTPDTQGDDYHVRILDLEVTSALLKRASLTVTRSTIIDGHIIFLTAVRGGTPPEDQGDG